MWIVKNRDGGIRLFKNKPKRSQKDIHWNVFHSDYGYYVDDAVREKFSYLTDEEEPIEVDIVVKK